MDSFRKAILKKSPQITNAGEGMEKREPPYAVGGTATMEKLYGGSLEN